ncbi:cupin domain-containing protein [Halobacteriales archaeon QS_1_68_44]|nr:MAG: cupin domain-containing protein [Halobacteriales archaeon QS_1_68_44]
MEHVAVDELDNWMGPADVKRPVGTALGTEHMGLRLYELNPGESTAFGYHAHENQEEVFYVIDGTLAFETEAGEVEVGAGEAIRFEPGEFQRSRNAGEGRARVLGIGAPADAGELTLLRECEACGERTDQEIEPVDDGAALATRCVDCGAETGRFS